jgi:hypothetical protein
MVSVDGISGGAFIESEGNRKVGQSVASGVDIGGLDVGVGPHGAGSGVLLPGMSVGEGGGDDGHELCWIVGVGVEDWVG